MKRLVQWALAAAVLVAISSCSKGSDPGTACPAGQTRQGTQCVSAGTVDGGVGATATACSTDGNCAGGLACLSGTCQVADATCKYVPPPGPFTPRVAWKWTGSPVQPDYDNVLMTPVVVPLHAVSSDVFAPPAVIFNSVPSGFGAGSALQGLVRAVSGRDGTELWTSDPAHPVNGLAGIAAGDILGDGRTMIVTARLGSVWPATDPLHQGPPTDDGLIAFDDQGAFLWEVKGLRVFWGAPSIANLYGGKEAQIILGATVVDGRGKILCQGGDGTGPNGIGENFLGPISTVADIDLDGVPEIVTGNTVYGNDCKPKPGWPNGQQDGLVAVAKFTDDPHPNIVVVAAGKVRLQDWQGKVIWGPIDIPPGGTAGGGPPTVADFDGDGKLEIGVAGKSSYTVFKPFAANPILWTKPTQDNSMVTGSSVFDFSHQGRAQVVYGDECYTRVFDGPSGDVLFQAQNPSCTVHENPVIADVDKDGRAEIVVATNSVCNYTCTAPDGTTWTQAGSGLHGITVFKDLRDHWVSTRPVWNQHAYHVTNVNEDGTIPVKEEDHWTATLFGESLNTFRMNPIGNADFRAPDLAVTPDGVTVDPSSCPGSLTLGVKVWNRGAVLVTAGIPVALYQGGAGGKLVAIARTAGAILPGASETVVMAVSPAPTLPTDFTVVANQDETGQGVVGECRIDNNTATVPALYCPTASK